MVMAVRQATALPALAVKRPSRERETLGNTHSFGCLTSRHRARESQGRICSDNCTRCHTEIEVSGQTFYLTQSQ